MTVELVNIGRENVDFNGGWIVYIQNENSFQKLKNLNADKNIVVGKREIDLSITNQPI